MQKRRERYLSVPARMFATHYVAAEVLPTLGGPKGVGRLAVAGQSPSGAASDWNQASSSAGVGASGAGLALLRPRIRSG